jgi:flagellar hook protein FlgE
MILRTPIVAKKNHNAASMPNQNDGRMYGILDDKYVTKNKDGTVLAKTKGHDILIQQDGGFQISDRKTGEVLVTKAGKKNKK